MGLLSGRWPVSLPSMLPPEFTARLMSRVAMRGADDCWEWTAGKVSAGYGAILLPHSISGAKKAQVPAHRLVCLIFHGPPPDADHFALHSCDNPPCCNPRHLRWGTHDENMVDAVERDRLKDNISKFNQSERNRGENHHASRLTERQVREIKARLSAGEAVRAVAREFGVWENSVRQIRDGKTWRWVA